MSPCFNVSAKPRAHLWTFPSKKKEKNQIILQAECSWNARDRVRFGVSSCKGGTLGTEPGCKEEIHVGPISPTWEGNHRQ